MTWDPRIPRWAIRFLMWTWRRLGVWRFIEDRIKEVTSDTKVCEVIKPPWMGCVFPHTGVVHAKYLDRWYGAFFWIYGMVHEAAHVQQWREGWDFSSPKTEWDAEVRAIQAFVRGLGRLIGWKWETPDRVG